MKTISKLLIIPLLGLLMSCSLLSKIDEASDDTPEKCTPDISYIMGVYNLGYLSGARDFSRALYTGDSLSVLHRMDSVKSRKYFELILEGEKSNEID